MEVTKENQYYCGKMLSFDPDSSPAAWEYYKTIYPSDGYLKEKYNFDELIFCYYNKERSNKVRHFTYENKQIKYNNRLSAISKQKGGLCRRVV